MLKGIVFDDGDRASWAVDGSGHPTHQTWLAENGRTRRPAALYLSQTRAAWHIHALKSPSSRILRLGLGLFKDCKLDSRIVYEGPEGGFEGTLAEFMRWRNGLLEAGATPQDPPVRSNPDWVDAIMKQHCQSISSYARNNRLPLPRFMESCQLPTEYGCGVYGCVYPTESADTVFKVTSDETEAHFIACYLQLQEMGVSLPGIIGYKAVLGLSGVGRGNRKVFAVWRESAFNVGQWEKGWREVLEGKFGAPLVQPRKYSPEEMCSGVRGHMQKQECLDQYALLSATLEDLSAAFVLFKLDASEIMKEAAKLQKTVGMENYFKLAQKFLHAAIDYEMNYASGDEDRKFVQYLRNCLTQAEEISGWHIAGDLGSTLEKLLRDGILIADLHAGNLGTRANSINPVITDPGHVVILDKKWAKADIPVV